VNATLEPAARRAEPGPPAPARAVCALEAIAARAWPAVETSERDGWWLRAGPEETWRTRSVLPQPPTPASRLRSLDERIAEVEAFYRERALPPRFQMHDAAAPEGLDAELAARGYTAAKPTHVLVAAIDVVLERTAASGGAPREVATAERADARWLAAYGRLQGLDAASLAQRAALFARIGPACVHGRIEASDGPLAAGFVVCEAGFAGLFGLVTASPARRRGLATALLRALFGAARERGAREAYLQVEAENTPALALYARCGFARHHGYHYRTAPDRAGTRAGVGG